MSLLESETHPNLIGGEWVQGTDAVADINPSDTNDIVGRYTRATPAQVASAIAAARAAFPAWSAASPETRADILDKVGSALLARNEEFGTLLAREEGKTRAEGIGETIRAGRIFKFFAGEALRNEGDILPSVRLGAEVLIEREALGVIGIIAPWNFPIAIPAWKIAPALAFGNCVVFKPAELVPGCAWIITKLLHEAGVPPGVFNLVMGQGSVVGEALLAASGIDAISFTGSVATGKRVALRCAESGKRVQLEMGGKNPMLVLDDADLDVAVAASINGAFFSTGQRCTASSRLIVTAGIHDRFVDAMRRRMASLNVGHALEPQTEIGPVVDGRQLEQVLGYVDIARAEGGTVIGGERLERSTPGFYLAPALVLDTQNAMRINREEVFGPVAGVIRVRDYEEGLETVNHTPFGLSAGVCTRSLKHATDFRKRAQAGMVMINLPTAGVDYHVPFGGRKASNYGPREQGRYAREFFTAVKTTYVAA